MVSSTQNTFEKINIEKEGINNIAKIDYTGIIKVPSIEEDSWCMSNTNHLLLQNPSITKIIFNQKHDYEYDYEQIKLLQEITMIYRQLLKNKKLLSYQAMLRTTATGNQYNASKRYTELHDIIYNFLLKDPIGTYVEIIRLIRKERIDLDKEYDTRTIRAREQYIEILEEIKDELEKTHLIKLAQPRLAGHKIGSREIYKQIFSPNIKPDFVFTKIMATYPKDAEEVAN